MRAVWTGSIGFGLINIPVKLYTATQSHHLDLNLLRQGDLCQISYARVCSKDGKEVPWEEIAKGYEYQEGDYVVLQKEDLKKITKEKSAIIDIKNFIRDDDIESFFYDTPFYVEPKKEGHKAYALLRETLLNTKTVGIGELVMRNREHLVIIKPHKELLILNKLRYAHEIRSLASLNLPKAELVKPKELEMAKQLISQLSEKFNPAGFKDTYINELKKIIEAKAKGKKLKTPPVTSETSKITDMMSLLKKSLVKKPSSKKARQG
jgi:DNA end-binding protein Ku